MLRCWVLFGSAYKNKQLSFVEIITFMVQELVRLHFIFIIQLTDRRQASEICDHNKRLIKCYNTKSLLPFNSHSGVLQISLNRVTTSWDISGIEHEEDSIMLRYRILDGSVEHQHVKIDEVLLSLWSFKMLSLSLVYKINIFIGRLG